MALKLGPGLGIYMTGIWNRFRASIQLGPVSVLSVGFKNNI